MLFKPRERPEPSDDEEVLEKILAKADSLEDEAKEELEKCPLTKEQLLQAMTPEEVQMFSAIPKRWTDRILQRLGIQ